MASISSRDFTSPAMGEDELVCSEPVPISYPDALVVTRSASHINSFDSSISSTLFDSTSSTSSFIPPLPGVEVETIHKQIKRSISLPDTRNLVLSPYADVSDVPTTISRSYLQSPSQNKEYLPPIFHVRSLALPNQPPLASPVPALEPAAPQPTSDIISQLNSLEILSHVSGSAKAHSSSTIQLLSDMSVFLQSTMDTCKTLHTRIQQELEDAKAAVRDRDNHVGATNTSPSVRDSGTQGSTRESIHGAREIRESQVPSFIRESSSRMSDPGVPSAQRKSDRSAHFDPPRTSSQNNASSGAPSSEGQPESWNSIIAHAPWFPNYDDESNRRPAHVAATKDNQLNTPVFAPQVERVHCPVQKLVEQTQNHRNLCTQQMPRNVDLVPQLNYNSWGSHQSQLLTSPRRSNGIDVHHPLARFNADIGQCSVHLPLPIICPKPSPVIPVRELEALLEMQPDETSQRFENYYYNPGAIPAPYLPPPAWSLYATQSPTYQYLPYRGRYSASRDTRFAPIPVDVRQRNAELRNVYGSSENLYGNHPAYQKPQNDQHHNDITNSVQTPSRRPWEAPSPSELPNPPWPGMTPSPPALVTFNSPAARGSPHSPTDSGFSEGSSF